MAESMQSTILNDRWGVCEAWAAYLGEQDNVASSVCAPVQGRYFELYLRLVDPPNHTGYKHKYASGLDYFCPDGTLVGPYEPGVYQFSDIIESYKYEHLGAGMLHSPEGGLLWGNVFASKPASYASPVYPGVKIQRAVAGRFGETWAIGLASGQLRFADGRTMNGGFLLRLSPSGHVTAIHETPAMDVAVDSEGQVYALAWRGGFHAGHWKAKPLYSVGPNSYPLI